MTHASVTGSPLEVPGDLIRLSVGIEDCDDLLDDLRQAQPTADPRRPAADRADGDGRRHVIWPGQIARPRRSGLRLPLERRDL